MRIPAAAALAILAACTAPAAVPSLSPSPSSAASPSSASPATPIVVTGDLARSLRPLVPAWRPDRQTLIVARSTGAGATTLDAIALDPVGPATPLVTFGPSAGWQLRSDGSLLAVALQTAADSGRIAMLDLRAGTARWVTDDEPGVWHRWPVWSPDGSLIFYSAAKAGTTDLGIVRFSINGSGKGPIHGPDGNGRELIAFTPDGAALVWSAVRAGGSTAVLDLATGRDRVFDDTTASTPLSFRAPRPRALVLVGGCCAGRPGGSLVLWDDLDNSRRPLVGIDSAPPAAIGGADWSPDGRLVVATLYDRSTPADSSGRLVYFDPADPGGSTAISGTAGAQAVVWPRSGIVYTRMTADRSTEFVQLARDLGASTVIARVTEPVVARILVVAP